MKAFNYKIEIIKSHRKTISIQIKSPELVLVRAPMHATQKTIQSVLKDKESWIHKHISQWPTLDEDALALDYSHGACWQILGETFYLDYKTDLKMDKFQLKVEGDKIYLTGPRMDEEITRHLMYEWIKRKLRVYLNNRLEVYEPILGVDVKRIVIKKQKTLWGSCSTRHNININIMVAFAPLAVVDYLLIHELCHLIEMNHSTKYWRLVESIMPDYKEKRLWLKNHNYLLKPTYF